MLRASLKSISMSLEISSRSSLRTNFNCTVSASLKSLVCFGLNLLQNVPRGIFIFFAKRPLFNFHFSINLYIPLFLFDKGTNNSRTVQIYFTYPELNSYIPDV